MDTNVSSNTSQQGVRRTSLVWSYIALTFCWIIIQWAMLSQKLPFDLSYCSKKIGFFTIYASKLSDSFTLWLPLLFFLFAHVLIQTVLTVSIYFCFRALLPLFSFAKKNNYLFGILFWLGCQCTLVLFNWYLFPYSFFSVLLSDHLPTFLLYALLIFFSLWTVFFLAVWFYQLAKNHRKGLSFIILMLGAWYGGSYLSRHFLSYYRFNNTQKPNVIVVITDSLRPDYAKGGENKTVHLATLIDQSAFFSNSLALLGRSTPGLVTILTGNYPKRNGARFNLLPPKFLQLDHSLTAVLKQNGYRTIFAADGRQFINISPQFHFDKIIAAKSGIYDFIFSLINDTPLSNLFMPTTIGKMLFPYNYGNRNSYFTYTPSQFVHLLDSQLNTTPKQPTLLVLALTVAHWPYVWAQQKPYDSLVDRYEDSVAVLDKQFNDIYLLLKKKGLTQNSIIVVLSDHGDSLGLPGDRVISADKYIGRQDRLPLINSFPYLTKGGSQGHLMGIDTSAGHGTDLLSMTQLQTTLAIYQQNVLKPQTVVERVALIDVMPTLLDLLNIQSAAAMDGISLKAAMQHPANKVDTRPFFLESEIDIPMIDVTQTATDKVGHLINQYSNLYDIDLPSQQLVLKDEAASRLLDEKQKGIMEGEWLLVYLPGKNRLQTFIVPPNQLDDCYYYLPAQKLNNKVTSLFCYRFSPTVPYYVLVNLRTKKWQVYLTDEVVADHVFNTLKAKLEDFFVLSSR